MRIDPQLSLYVPGDNSWWSCGWWEAIPSDPPRLCPLCQAEELVTHHMSVIEQQGDSED